MGASSFVLGRPAWSSGTHWIYADSAELFQVLHKAAFLQEQLEDRAICPVLICRRVSFIAERMSADFGFRILVTRAGSAGLLRSVRERSLSDSTACVPNDDSEQRAFRRRRHSVKHYALIVHG